MAWPTDPLTVEVALALGADLTADPGTWSFSTDITTYTFDRDGDNSIVITRGRRDESTVAPPSSISLTVNNSDGRFSPRNPTGAYYGSLRRNTPLRVRVNPGSGLDTRNVAFLTDLPPQWDAAEADHHVPIRAEGILRRLGQGNAPAKSVARATIDATNRLNPGRVVGYWPLEDGPDSTRAATALLDGTPASTVGTVVFASVTPPPGSTDAPDLTAGGLRATCNTTTVTSAWSVTCFVKCTGSCRVLSWSTSTGRSWVVDISPTTVTVTASTTETTSFSADYTDGEWHTLTVTATNSGSDVSFALLGDTGDTSSPGSVTGAISGRVLEVLANPLLDTDLTSVSQLVVNSVNQRDIAESQLDGEPGLNAATRFDFACSAAGILADIPGYSRFDSALVGAQPIATTLGILRECEAADSGLIVERRNGQLGFDVHTDRENLTVALTLDYASGHVSPPLELTDDDQRIRNDVTVTRTGGSSGRVVDENGPLGVDALGRYDEDVNLNLYTDDQAAQHAGWRVNLGTADGLRFPTITVNLRRNTSLIAAWLALDIGSRILITNLPDNISYDDVDLIVEGYAEQISQKNWIITFNCAPYQPYKVFELADPTADADPFVGRLAGDDAAIRVAIDDNDTSIEFDPNRYRWTTVADDFDPDLRVRFGGETADISTIATTAGTFVAAGAMSSADNAAVTPALYAGHTTRDLICVLARIRSASAGTLGTPTDYTRLPITGFDATSPMQLFVKVHDGSESNPTVTPTGGAAGDTVSAVTFGLRGTPTTLDDLADIVVASLGQSNASAQNIAYPGLYPRYQEGCIILALGGKDDDWTSVAALSGFTEAVDSSTTTGNDQGLVVDYVIQTTPAVINEGSFTVTGGASAVSDAIVVALAAGYQTMTVSARSVNGVVKSHAAGTRIEVENAFVLGL